MSDDLLYNCKIVCMAIASSIVLVLMIVMIIGTIIGSFVHAKETKQKLSPEVVDLIDGIINRDCFLIVKNGYKGLNFEIDGKNYCFYGSNIYIDDVYTDFKLSEVEKVAINKATQDKKNELLKLQLQEISGKMKTFKKEEPNE